MKEVLKLNEISPIVDKAFKQKYTLVKNAENPQAVMLRSFDMHDYQLPKSVLCVGRAGAGVNNIPCERYASDGVVVFNSPGANANAVKELVLCALFLCGRKITDGINWANSLKGNGEAVAKLVEDGKKDFIGGEIYGKTLGVVGLGAIGALVANAAIDLGMQVIGFDPFISINAAWNLNHNVKRADDLNHMLKSCDFLSLHVPLSDSTRQLINKDSIALLKDGASIINCSRGELVNNADIIAALKSGKLNRYATDFPTDELLNEENVIAIPHLGASTPEAEDNCAYMVAKQIVDFIENGNITNSANFPNCSLPKLGKQRITFLHANVKNVLSSVSDLIGKNGINISGLVSQAKNKTAYAIIDIDDMLPPHVLKQLESLENIIKVRVID